jgi:hypothetical protein
MLSIAKINASKGKIMRATCISVALLIVVGSLALAEQDKYALKIPDGLALSNFRGYENWEDASVSQTKTGIKVIVANPVMLEAFKSGLPASGKCHPTS